MLERQIILDNKLTDIVWQRHDVEAILGYGPAKERFDQARLTLFRLGIVSALGTMALVWSVNGPDPQSETVIRVQSAAIPSTAVTPYPVGANGG